MAKILLIDDDVALGRMLKSWLTMEQHSLETVEDGIEALEKLKVYDYDLVILDWQLPGIDGVELLKEFRALGASTPVLMLTGKVNIADKEVGFTAGADDYLTKPFQAKELSARVGALLRRCGSSPDTALKCGDLTLDRKNYCVRKGDRTIQLLPRELALLEFFFRHPNQVFDSETLLNRVWASESDSTIDALTTCIKRIRKKVDQGAEQSIIRTVYGVGYKLERK